MKDCFFYEIKALNNVKIFKNVNIKKETNFKLNTTFLYKIEIYSFLSVNEVFNLLKKYNIKHYILGNASNVLFAQTTYKAALIKIMTRSHKSLNILNAGDNLNVVNIVLRRNIWKY